MKGRLGCRWSAAMIAALMLCAHVRGAILDDLIYYLPLDENAADQSGNSVATTIHNSVLFDSAGVVGNAARIVNSSGANTATANYITSDEELTIGRHDFSVSIWVRGDDSFSINQNDAAIFSNKNWNSGLGTGWVIARGTVEGGGGWQWNFSTSAAGRVDFDPPRGSSFIEDSRWHHIAVTHDRDGDAAFYFDGASIGSSDISAHQFSSIDAGLPVGIGVDGARGDPWNAFINGSVDEAAIWQRVLDDAEVQAIYDGGVQGVPLTDLSDPLRLTLEVHRENGAMELRNNTLAAIDIRGYSILSAAGALVPDRWTSIARGGDADSGGTVDTDDRWVEFTNPETFRDLSEGSLGVGTLSPGQSFSLGVGSWLQYPDEDLAFEYLDREGKVVSTGAIHFIGNDSSPFVLGDLDFDGELSPNDWLVFAEGLGRTFPDLTIAQAYQQGDLNGDLTNGHADFLAFQVAYDRANGMGAFSQMIELVPEPTGWTSFLVGAMCLALRRRRISNARGTGERTSGWILRLQCCGWKSQRWEYPNCRSPQSWDGEDPAEPPPRLVSHVARLVALLVAMILLFHAPNKSLAQVILLEENFEGLSLELGPFVSPTESGGDGTDWTATPPIGWSIDNRQMSPDGVREFDGWTFLDVDAWSQTAGDQQRSLFVNGDGVVAVADPDEWQDSDAAGFFNSFLESPQISLAGVDPGTVTIEFDSSWRDENEQTAVLQISYDGGPDVEVLRWESQPNSLFFKDDAPNERIHVPIIHPSNAQNMVVKWGLVDAGNNWWWAIDNLRVASSDSELALKLVVNTATGNVGLSNDTEDTISLNYYQIDSVRGSLDVDRWNSLEDQRIDAIGPDPGEGWTMGGGSNPRKLVEAFLLGTTTLDRSETLSLGRAYDEGMDAQDLEFSYGTADGALHAGIVRYINSGLLCDFDGDDDCDVVDIDSLFAKGDLTIGVPVAEVRFDLNGDGTLDAIDVDRWLEAAGVEHGFVDAVQRGDANLDGSVDAQDLNRLGVRWLQSDLVWSTGDFNGDGIANALDLNLLGLRWQSSVVQPAAASVPEPSGHIIVVLLLSGVLLWRRR